MLKPVVLFAFRGLVRRPLQTVLLWFALSIAISATMTIMAVLSGVQEQMRRDLERVGLNVVNVHISPDLKNLFLSPLKVEDSNLIRQKVAAEVAPFRARMAVINSERNRTKAQVLMLSTQASWAEVVPLEFLEGRFFREHESDACVLDEWVAESLFDGPALGKTITARWMGRTKSFQIVGVMKDPFEIRKRFDELDVTGSARSRVLRMMEFKSVYVRGDFSTPADSIHGTVVKVPEGVDPYQAADRIHDLLDNPDEVWVWARAQWVGNILKVADFSTNLASVIWVIVLGVTCVMIMTVSLIAIRERYREIAIRRTEGAVTRQVVLQLLCENVTLSFTAGVTALALAIQAGRILESRYISWPPAFLPNDMALSLGLSILIGAMATILPAMRVARIDPVKVLREH